MPKTLLTLGLVFTVLGTFLTVAGWYILFPHTGCDLGGSCVTTMSTSLLFAEGISFLAFGVIATLISRPFKRSDSP
ncbi:MAG: hypothetical protein OK452_05205 [Thaumarchaeota archaeon]|nr:hypothetical protein [Nitrososphaerota archaeon]